VEFDRPITLQRCIWTIVFFSVLNIGTQMFGQWSEWSGYAVIGPLTTLVGTVGILLAWTTSEHRFARFELTGMVTSLATVVLAQAPVIASMRYFDTDAAAFNQRAAQLLLGGINPYLAHFTPAGLSLDHPAAYWTYTLTGHYVNAVSYPAGSFLIQAPFQWLGLTHMTTNWVDLFAWLAAAIIIYRISPRNAKWIAPLMLLATEFTYLFSHGATDAVFVPFVMLAALRWDDFVVASAPRWTRWLGPVALGIACSVKQTPWFLVPFFLVGVAIEASHHERQWWRESGRYLAIVAGTFLLINAPFILWSPSAWVRGSLLPLTSPLVPDGQGLIGLVLHGFVRGVHTTYLDLAAGLLLIALLAGFVVWYPALKRLWMFILPVVLYVPSRSLSTYLVDFIPAAFVMALTTQRVPERWSGRTHLVLRRWAVVVPSILAGVALVAAMSFPVITVKAEVYGSSHYNQYINPMYLSFENNTGQTLHPHVMLVVGSGHPVGFWSTLDGSTLTLAPHQTRQLWMKPPLYMGPPSYLQHWLVEVFTATPNSMSVSRAYVWPYGKKYSDNP
jgi:uncharacterized membrane protein